MEIIPPINSPKPHSSTNFDSKNFLSFYSSEIEEKAAPQEKERHFTCDDLVLKIFRISRILILKKSRFERILICGSGGLLLKTKLK